MDGVTLTVSCSLAWDVCGIARDLERLIPARSSMAAAWTVDPSCWVRITRWCARMGRCLPRLELQTEVRLISFTAGLPSLSICDEITGPVAWLAHGGRAYASLAVPLY